jgi:NAD(P)-dependent dehydrogenase (short-subunit alcohol dehydrogenase family)
VGAVDGDARVAVVTGASRGIGAATARALARDGWDVAVGYVHDEASAAAVVAECEALGRRAVALQGDLRHEAAVVELFASVDERLGPLGALVNNAGIVEPKADVEDLDEGRLLEVLAVNVVGPFLCAREAVRRMARHHGGAGGVIVNVSSAAARRGGAHDYVDYAASKAALDAMTTGLAGEVAGQGVRVVSVRPGLIDTDIHARNGQPDRLARLGPGLPMGRVGTAEEVAEAIAWLCSERASYVTGSVVEVSGGL